MKSAETIRVAPALPMMRVLSDFGLDPAAVLAEAGWPMKLLEDPDETVSYAAVGRLVALAAARTGCEHIGLLIGRQGGLATLGALGFAVRHASDVRSALSLLVRHFAQHDSGGVVVLSEDGPVASLGYRISAPRVDGGEQIADTALAIGFQMVKALCGPDWRPQETILARHRPADPRPYLVQFGQAVRFDAEDSALVFPARWLDRPVPGADPELQRLLLRMIGGETEGERDLGEKVRRVLTGMLGRGAVNQKAVARTFGVSSRTLHRRLATLGTSFQALLDGVRCDMACRLLEDTTLPVGQVALVLDYGEASAFTRSFKRRLGCSPAAWRAQHAAMASAAERL